MRFPVVVLLLSLALPATAQRTPSQMASLMGRGINLGNTLEPPTEGSWKRRTSFLSTVPLTSKWQPGWRC
jgi:hypothetical protein